jgi:hypothetical protein
MTNFVDKQLSETMDRVRQAIASHERGEKAPLSLALLRKVQAEVELMKQHLDPKVFKPSYPRFVLDWPDETGLVKLLVDVAYAYEKIKR